MQNLKKSAISGVFWNASGNFISLFVEFIVGIILARLLTPSEFGLIGTISILIVLSDVLINSGMNQAIIRKQNCTQIDYSTAFFFNLVVAVVLFFIFYFSAGYLSILFNNHDLKKLIQVLGISLIISSFSLIQQAKLSKELNFKLQIKVTIISSLLSGACSIVLAFLGFGVWSLVFKSLLSKSFTALFFWIQSKWRPNLIFNTKSFKELFNFGSKLLFSGFIGTFLNNINHLVIAKYFSPQDLGYYSRAEMFKNLPSQNISSVITSVGYPVLAKIQDDKAQMKKVFKKMFLSLFFVTTMLMFGLAAISKYLILTLIGVQWLPSVEILQLLCFVGLIYPLNSLNINLVNVVGRSDLYFKLQLIVQVLTIPNIFIGIAFGIKALIIGMIIISIIGYFIFNYQSNKILNYPISEQLKDIFPTVILGFVMASIVYFTSEIIVGSTIIILILQIFSGSLFVIICGELFKIDEYLFIKDTIREKLVFITKH